MGESLNRGEVLAPAGPVRRRAPRQVAVRGVVRTVWQHLIPPDVSVVRVLPDAAVDLVFVADRLTVAGPDTTACVSELPPGRPVLGFQLRPGAVSAVLGAPADVLRDERVELAELWGQEGRDLEEAMVEAENARVAADALEVALGDRLGPKRTDPLPDHLAAQLRAGRAVAAADLGLSERQLRRRCTTGFGYGPKVLTRVVRFQSFLERLRVPPSRPLAQVAVESGYADQAHLGHDVRALSGLTPAVLRSMLAASDFDKTPAPGAVTISA